MKKEAWEREEIEAWKERGAVLCSTEQMEARRSVCESCDEFVDLSPLPFLTVKGCGICKCPIATKGRTLKYFSFTKGRIVKTECPHPEGNKWESVDNQF